MRQGRTKKGRTNDVDPAPGQRPTCRPRSRAASGSGRRAVAPGSSPGLRLNFVLLRSVLFLSDGPGATQEEFQLRRPSSGSVAERTGELDCLDSALGVVGSNTRVPF